MQTTQIPYSLPPQYSAPPPPPPPPVAFTQRRKAWTSNNNPAAYAGTATQHWNDSKTGTNYLHQQQTAAYFYQQPVSYADLYFEYGNAAAPSYGDYNVLKGHRHEANNEPPQQYSCDACDKVFPRPQQLQTHIKSHKKCSVCEYNANARLVSEHEEDAHGIVKDATLSASRMKSKVDGNFISPLVKNIPLDSPEDIAKWILERKKNWPSAQNVERKLKERVIKEESHIIDTQFNKKRGREDGAKGKGMKRLKCTIDGQSANEGSAKKGDNGQNSKKAVLVSGYSSSDFESGKALYPSSILESDANSSSDDSNAPPIIASSKDPLSYERAALSKCDTEDLPRSGKQCRFFAQGNCMKGDRCPFRHNVQNQKKSPSKPTSISSRPSLLKMLLTDEIKREQAIILQCLHYIVRNDFFGIGSDNQHKVKLND